MIVLAALMAASGFGAVLAPAAGASVPPGPKASVALPSGLEPASPYLPADSCDYTIKPGVARFADLIQRSYPGTGSYGVVSSCPAEGMVSEHTEGRAWDWAVSVRNPAQVAQVTALFAWLLAPDSAGRQAASARRLGIMYIIWNRQILGIYDLPSGWQPYSCSGVTGCHQDHVHFSFSWAGAQGATSFWTGRVAPTDYGPCVGPGQMFALPYSGFNGTPCADFTPVAANSTVVRAIQGYQHATLATGSAGPAVSALQQALGGQPVNGAFDAQTRDLVTTFQERQGLPASGTVDQTTWAALVSFVSGGEASLSPVAAPSPVAVSRGNAVLAPAALTPGQYLRSTNGRFAAVLQGDGNFVVYGDGAPRWSANTTYLGTVLALQGDGNLVVYGPNSPLWASRTAGSGAANFLVMQDDGNLVLYAGSGRPLWATGR
ncbi:MAG TPA: peptidoglycan-binding protein [Mycobacteriales bacterium]|nr:peptidoglycan-binding protein [Mycobacteriales bacterium]